MRYHKSKFFKHLVFSLRRGLQDWKHGEGFSATSWGDFSSRATAAFSARLPLLQREQKFHPDFFAAWKPQMSDFRVSGEREKRCWTAASVLRTIDQISRTCHRHQWLSSTSLFLEYGRIVSYLGIGWGSHTSGLPKIHILAKWTN